MADSVKTYRLSFVVKVTSTSEPTKICNDITNVASIYTDGKTITPVKEYKYSTTGQKSVIIRFNTPSLIEEQFSGLSITRVSLLDSKITEIPNGCFSGCTSLIGFQFPSTIVKIGSHAFDNAKLSNNSTLTLTSIKEIGSYAFFNVDGIRVLSINNTRAYTTIGAYAFAECSTLYNVKLTSVSKIGNGAFYNNALLASISFGERLTMIGAYAFGKCPSVTSISFSALVGLKRDSNFSGSKIIEGYCDVNAWGYGTNDSCGSKHAGSNSFTYPRGGKNYGEDTSNGVYPLYIKNYNCGFNGHMLYDDEDTYGYGNGASVNDRSY